MDTTVRYERDRDVGYITLNRPQVLNAINEAWIRDLLAAARAAGGDSDARVVVVRGTGRAFCAGADVKEIPRLRDLTEYREHIVQEQEIARVFRRIGKPVIAQIHGYAVGGGCELALLADMRVAAAGTKFGFPEVRVGATVTLGGLYSLARVVGLGRAFELVYTTELIDADEAYRIGLVNRVVDGEQLPATVRALAEKIAGHFPFEVALSRNSIHRALDIDFDASVEEETEAAILSFMGGSRTVGMAKAIDRTSGKQETPMS